MKIYRNSLLRRLVLPLLQRLNFGDIRIRHHYTHQKILLHSFRHKGYWYHGKNREAETMLLFKKIIKPGDVVVEIGGHIGYLSAYYSSLVGAGGKVYVFEPGPNNLPYIERNLAPLANVELIEKAVAEKNGEAAFYIENLTGQNNTLVDDFAAFSKNKRISNSNESYEKIAVEAIRLDNFLEARKVQPQLIKIDIEGGEWSALQGMFSCLERDKPILMVEVSANREQIFKKLQSFGYVFFKPALQPVNTPERLRYNIFCFHAKKHRQVLAGLKQNQTECQNLF